MGDIEAETYDRWWNTWGAQFGLTTKLARKVWDYQQAKIDELQAENAKLQGNIDKVGKYIVEHERQWPYTKSCEVMFDKYGKFIGEE